MFSKLYSYFGRSVKIVLGLVNYATKSHIKKIDLASAEFDVHK